MKYYAGLDVAMKETFICILSKDGQKVFESKAQTDPHPIYEELTKRVLSHLLKFEDFRDF